MTRLLSEPSRLAAAVFLLLVGATIAAFFAAQRLKHQPPLLRQKGGDRAFSPNGDGIKDTARITFKLPKQDDVTVTILDDEGGIVARVIRNKSLAGHTVHTLRWDGHTAEGTVAAEGTYSVLVSLRKGGRTDTLEREIDLDLDPPHTRVIPVRGPSQGPFIIDGELRRTATVRLASGGREPGFSVWRTDGPRSKLVVPDLPITAKRTARWNGLIAGKPAPPGTYLISGDIQDRAGNVGTAPAEVPPPEEGPAPGGVGVVVRPLAIMPPRRPVATDSRTRLTIATGGRRYRWTLRRVGGGVSDEGKSKARRLQVRIPPGPSGAYVLTVAAAGHTARAVVPVIGPGERRMLVVLPLITWQGKNDVDDSGDGLPDSLERGRPARFDRPFARGELPPGFRSHEAPFLAFLHRNQLRYDITTDLALARGTQIPFVGYKGVVLAGDARWFQDSLGKQLHSFVARGGRVLVLGTNSLRRTTLIRGGKLRKPSFERKTDMLDAVVQPLERKDLELLVQSDDIRLFEGTAGSLGTFGASETTASVEGGHIVASAGPIGEQPVFVAYKLGQGLVVRPGVPDWSRSLDDPVGPSAETTRRIWTLLG